MSKIGLSTLLGENIIEHMETMRCAEETVKNYYYSTSKLWGAVKEYLFSFGRSFGKNHVQKIREDCALIDWPKAGERVHSYNSGYGISFHKAYIGYANHVLVYECSITFDCDENTPRCSHDCHGNPIFEQIFDFVVPKELELDFDQSKFDTWIKGLETEKVAKNREKDLQELARLKAIYEP